MIARFVSISGRLAVMLLGLSWAAAAQRVPGNCLCTTYMGPAFIIPTESRATIAVHGGSFLGISLLSLTTGHLDGRISLSEPILAGIIPRGSGSLTLAISDAAGLRISTFGVASRQLMSTELFRGIDAEQAIFSPNGKLLLGITKEGTVFKIEVGEKRFKEGKGVRISFDSMPESLAVSPSSGKLYMAGVDLTIVDIVNMRISSVVTAAKNPIEVAASPAGHTVVVRTLHDLKIFEPATADSRGPLASAVVDATPNGASISSAARLAFSSDGSELFYIRATGVHPDLISLSMDDLHIKTRIPIGRDPNAIAVVPGLGWVLVLAGGIEDQYLEAVDMKTRKVIYKTALKKRSSVIQRLRQTMRRKLGFL